MKKHYGNYLGVVVNTNDPTYRGRVQVFVPHVMPTLYEGWNKEGNNITFDCVGDNMPRGLTSEIIQKLQKILPWAEAASPIVGQGISGGIVNDQNYNNDNPSADNNTQTPTLNLDQTPTAAPTGNVSSESTKCQLPKTPTADTKNLAPGFVQRLNGLYKEATALGYKITCYSGFRTFEKQKSIFDQDVEMNKGKPSGFVSPPGGTSHELGLAVDITVEGNGVSITKLTGAAELAGINYDTPAWKALLAKYNLHQPLHPKLSPAVRNPESWHIEPIETPLANQATRAQRKEAFERLLPQFKNTDQSKKIGETASSSQLPALPVPIDRPNPSATDKSEAIAPTTGLTAFKPISSTNDPTLSGKNQLATDRIKYFRAELQDPELLDRLQFVMAKETGDKRTFNFNPQAGSLIFETMVNRAYFSNRTLRDVAFEREYFKDAAAGDANATRTIKHNNVTLDIIKRVIYNGQNITDLATDHAYNDSTMFANKFLRDGVAGSWFNLDTGTKITDPNEIKKLTSAPGTGGSELIYQKCGHGPNGHSKAGERAHAYGLKYNIKSTEPSTFQANTPLPPELEDVIKSPLTDKPYRTVQSPNIVNTPDQHGPTIVKNTNDLSKGLFAIPGMGSMVWIFFREGNPLFPVYFAASYGSREWKSAYNTEGISADGSNQPSTGSQVANTMRLNPNAGGGIEISHIKDASDPSGAGDKAVAMMYGDDGSNIAFTKGYHQIYTRHNRRDQIDGDSFMITHGNEEKWIEHDSSTNVRGNLFLNVGKIDAESLEAIKELSEFSYNLNQTLMTNSAK